MEKDLYPLPEKINRDLIDNVLSSNRKIYLDRPFDSLIEENFVYNLSLIEGNKLLGVYNLNSINFLREKRTLYITYALYSFKKNSHVCREILTSFSKLQQFLSKENNIVINEFSPIIACANKKKGLANILEELDYELIDSKNLFYGKTYSPDGHELF